MKLHELLKTKPEPVRNGWKIAGVTYTKQEAKILSDMSDADKLQVHEVKSVFGGFVVC